MSEHFFLEDVQVLSRAHRTRLENEEQKLSTEKKAGMEDSGDSEKTESAESA